jgi:hypothetical protein
VVGDLDQGLGDTAVDELHAKDVGIGEGRLDVGLELGLNRDRCNGLGLCRCVSAIAACNRSHCALGSKRGSNDATYIFLREGSGNAQSEQGERRPLEVDHCSGLQGERGVMMKRRRG